MILEGDHPAKDPTVGSEREQSAREHLVEEIVRFGVIVSEHDLPRDRPESLPKVHVHSVLPIGVSHRVCGARDEEPTRHEEVVRDRVRREVGEVAQSDGEQWIGIRRLKDLLPDVPVVGVTPDGCVLLCEGDVRRHGSVQELGTVASEQSLDGGGQQMERREHGFADGDVRARSPRRSPE